MSDRLAILIGHDPSREAEGARLLQSLLRHGRTDWRLYVGWMAPAHVPRHAWMAHPRVVVRNEWPREGVSRGFNALARLGDEAWMAWLNNDAEVEEAWDAEAVATLLAHPAAGMAALPYLTPHHPVGYHVNEFPSGLLYANFGVFRRTDFEAVGGFDDRIRMYGCDNALCLRFQAARRPLVVSPRSRVVHHYREDEARADTMSRYEELRRSWADVWTNEWQPRIPELMAIQQAMPRYDLVQQPIETYARKYGVTERGHATEVDVVR